MSYHLTDDQRAVLAGLLADFPDLSQRRIAELFEAMTGRPIGHTAVGTVGRRGARVWRSNGHLSDAHRAILVELIEAAGPGTPCREIAYRFMRKARRRITIRTVWGYAVRLEGRPRRIREAAP